MEYAITWQMSKYVQLMQLNNLCKHHCIDYGIHEIATKGPFSQEDPFMIWMENYFVKIFAIPTQVYEDTHYCKILHYYFISA